MATALRGLKVEIIPNAIQTAFVKAANPKSGNKILYIGRLTADKGVDKILESALQLPNFKFIMVGSGPLKTQLKSAGLKVYDKMSHRKIMDLLLKVDLLLLPASQVDPFGLTVLEAMSRNVPALISDKVGISSYLNHGKNVFVIADSLTSSIQNIFADQKKLQFVISHLEPTYRKFKYAKMADSYWKIFQRL